VAECLPGTAGTIYPIEPAGHVVEVDLSLLASAVENALEVDLVARVLGQFFGALNRQAHDFIAAVGCCLELIKGSFAFLARVHQTRFLQQTQMGGDP